MEDKNKHLEFVQGIINRMGQNSFLIKSWTITLVSALFAIAAKDANQNFVIIAYFPTLAFWLLDSYYLYQERLFRKVYKHVCSKTIIDFSMSTEKFDKGFSDWATAVLSKTILLFYGIVFITQIIIMFYLN